MKFYWAVLGILAVWRVTRFLNAEDGPWDVVVRLRVAVGNGFWGKLLDCFYCLSVWISAPFACLLGETWKERFLLWLSFSAGANLLEKLTALKVPPAPYVEGPVEEHQYGMLWTEKSTSSEANPSDTRRGVDVASGGASATRPISSSTDPSASK